MLTLPEVQAELGRVSYRPGWTVTAWQHRFEGVWVTIAARVEDSYHPGEHVDLGIHSPLPPMRDAGAVHDWLAWRLGIIELHEMREWLRVDGVPVFDPHVDGVNEPPA